MINIYLQVENKFSVGLPDLLLIFDVKSYGLVTRA